MLSVCYLLHFHRPIGNPANSRALAQHYGGWAVDLDARDGEHRAGRGAAITRWAVQQGIGWDTFVLGYGDWHLEKRIKALKNYRRICPICGTRHPAGRLHIPATPVLQLAFDLDGDPFDVAAPAPRRRIDPYEWLTRRSWTGPVGFGGFELDTSDCAVPF